MKKSTKTKMTRDTIPENFTLSLATVDAIPVLFFALTMILLGKLLGSPLFILGAALAFASGAVKVLWKYLVVLQHRNVWWMFLQMRILMPVGMLLMLLGFAVKIGSINMANVWRTASSFPAGLFFLIGILGMILMIIFAVKLDSSDVRSNWIEQTTNGLAQISFFIGVLMIVV